MILIRPLLLFYFFFNSQKSHINISDKLHTLIYDRKEYL